MMILYFHTDMQFYKNTQETMLFKQKIVTICKAVHNDQYAFESFLVFNNQIFIVLFCDYKIDDSISFSLYNCASSTLLLFISTHIY